MSITVQPTPRAIERPGDARTELPTRARSRRERPTAHVQPMLPGCVTARGVRWDVATLHELAGGIAAGCAVEWW